MERHLLIDFLSIKWTNAVFSCVNGPSSFVMGQPKHLCGSSTMFQQIWFKIRCRKKVLRALLTTITVWKTLKTQKVKNWNETEEKQEASRRSGRDARATKYNPRRYQRSNQRYFPTLIDKLNPT